MELDENTERLSVADYESSKARLAEIRQAEAEAKAELRATPAQKSGRGRPHRDGHDIRTATPLGAPCYSAAMPHPQITRATIEGIDFTLNFDYDQLRDGKLHGLSEGGLIEWFRRRMRFVFLEPLSSLYGGRHSVGFRALNSIDVDDLPARSFVVATFSVLLNGVEALGSFLTPLNIPKRKGYNRQNFDIFIATYMPQWKTPRIRTFLWEQVRNGIAHGFRIEGGGIDNEADDTRWVVTPTLVQIGPNTFFREFRDGVNQFLVDIEAQPATRATFLARFRQLYPH